MSPDASFILSFLPEMVVHAGEGYHLTKQGIFTGTALSTNCRASSGGSGCQIEDRAKDRARGRAFTEAGFRDALGWQRHPDMERTSLLWIGKGGRKSGPTRPHPIHSLVDK